MTHTTRGTVTVSRNNVGEEFIGYHDDERAKVLGWAHRTQVHAVTVRTAQFIAERMGAAFVDETVK